MDEFIQSDLLQWWTVNEWLNKLNIAHPDWIILDWQVVAMSGLGFGGNFFVVARIKKAQEGQQGG